MNPEIKKQWVEALRSGEYKQGYRTLARLTDDDSGKEYCCLGVLCELAVKEGIITKRVLQDDSIVTYGSDSSYLPAKVWRWAGLDSNDNPKNPEVNTQDINERYLGNINDSEEVDFNGIADIIERKL